MNQPISTSGASAFSFLPGASSALLAVDAGGILAFGNQQAAQLFGYSEQELVGSSVEVLTPKSDHKGAPGNPPSVRPRAPGPCAGVGREVRAVDRQGREFPFEIGLTPIHTNSGTSVVVAIADITIRKHLRREISAAKLVREAMPPRFFP